MFEYGKGINLYTSTGEKYIDAESGTFNLSLGYNHPKLVDFLSSQVKKIIHLSSHFSKQLKEEVISRIVADAPKGIVKGWMRDLTGSTANEGAVKMAQKFSGKRDVLSFYYSHHGQTLFTMGISGNTFRRRSFSSSGQESLHVAPPYCYRCPYNAKYPGCGFLCVEAMDFAVKHAGSGNVACMLVEPILGNGGNIVPPEGYFTVLKKFCEENEILIIADEVQTGIGRTGYMFASEAFKIEPDIITLAKGLGGIGVPIAAILYKEELDVLESFEHSFTSGGNLLSLGAARCTMEVIEEEDILQNVKDNGLILKKLLNRLKNKYKFIGDVRGMGYMWGLEIIDNDGMPDSRLTENILKTALKSEKLILRSSQYGKGNVVKIRPALIATTDELVEIVDRLDRVFQLVNQ